MKEVRSFLGHPGFCRRFIKDFSKIANPLSIFLQKDVAFDFGDRCKDGFDTLKKALTTTPIIQPLDWTSPFELMCDTSNFAVGAVLAQRNRKLPHVIYYPSRTLDTPQANDTIIEKELLAVVFALDKFRPYTTWFQGNCLYWSCSIKIPFEESRFETKVDQIDATAPRVWHWDSRQKWGA